MPRIRALSDRFPAFFRLGRHFRTGRCGCEARTMPDVVRIPSPTGVVIAADHWADHSNGAAAPVVLAHGGGQTRHSWGGTAQALADAGHRVVSMDLRGHGDSTWAPDHDYTMTTFRDDALAVADWIGEPITWVGASLGGMSGLHAVDERPDAFRALVLVDITPHPAKQGVDKILGFMGANARGGVRVARRGRRRDRRIPATPHATEGPVGPRQEPASRRGRPLALALGSRRSSTSAPAARASTPAMPITTNSPPWHAGCRSPPC